MKQGILWSVCVVWVFSALVLVGAVAWAEPAGAAGAAPGAHRYDFGAGETAEGYVAVGPGDAYSAERGYAWVEGALQERDREGPDALRRDFVFGQGPARFRVDVEPGIYRLGILVGDLLYWNHVLRVRIEGVDIEWPAVSPGMAEFVTLEAAFEVSGPAVVVAFDSPMRNWVLNALWLERADQVAEVRTSSEQFQPKAKDTWLDVRSFPDPTVAYMSRFRSAAAAGRSIEPTGLDAKEYLRLIEGNVDYFKGVQNEQGAIIDPYREIEWQYATPCFALAAATVAVKNGRADLLEPAARAMDWATVSLAKSEAPQNHEDFYAPVLAHALDVFEGQVAPERMARWRETLTFVPWGTYTSGPGGGNWNVVALSGEYLFFKAGLREDIQFVEQSLGAQGSHFQSPWGLYCEGPMAYDHFPRLWAADMMAAGYNGAHAEDLGEMLRRASLTSLLIQSPTGELPVGHRSAHHQWNEAEQCVTYEIYAAKAQRQGDEALARAFKRAAHLALQSIGRWQRPSGELWIVKNRVDPARQHGYMGYSSHSQYNLLAMAMLSIAYGHAQATEEVPEGPAPCDVGGFVIQLGDFFHKVIANAGGFYVEVDWQGHPEFNPAGLLRIHRTGVCPQLGPSDGLLRGAHGGYPEGPRTTAAVGAGWRDASGAWRYLAEFVGDRMGPVECLNVEEQPGQVGFELVYRGEFGGPERVVERYELRPDALTVRYEWPGYEGPVRVVWPVFADDGEAKTKIDVEGMTVTVSLYGDRQVFRAEGVDQVSVGEALYPFPNGWARVAVAENVQAGPVVLHVEPRHGGTE